MAKRFNIETSKMRNRQFYKKSGTVNNNIKRNSHNIDLTFSRKFVKIHDIPKPTLISKPFLGASKSSTYGLQYLKRRAHQEHPIPDDGHVQVLQGRRQVRRLYVLYCRDWNDVLHLALCPERRKFHLLFIRFCVY